MDGVALCIDGHLVIQRIGDQAVCFFSPDVRIHDKKTITDRRLDRSIQMISLEKVFCNTRVEKDLYILRVQRTDHKLQEFGERRGWKLADTSQKMLCKYAYKVLIH